MSMSTKKALRAAIKSRLPCLEELLKEKSEPGNIKFEGMFFSRPYLEEMVALLKDVFEDDKKTDYRKIYEAISLEMISNSQFWCEIRLHARRLC